MQNPPVHIIPGLWGHAVIRDYDSLVSREVHVDLEERAALGLWHGEEEDHGSHRGHAHVHPEGASQRESAHQREVRLVGQEAEDVAHRTGRSGRHTTDLSRENLT